jgi:hypothetical protein
LRLGTRGRLERKLHQRRFTDAVSGMMPEVGQSSFILASSPIASEAELNAV